MAEANAERSVSITFPNYPSPRSDWRRSEGISDMAIRTQVNRIVFRIFSATTAMFTAYSRSADFQVRTTTLWPPQNMARQTRDTRSIAAPISSPWLRRIALQANARRHGYRPRRTSLSHWLPAQ